MKGMNYYSRLLLHGAFACLLCLCFCVEVECAPTVSQCSKQGDASYYSGSWDYQSGSICQQACLYYAAEADAVATNNATELENSINNISELCRIWRQWENSGTSPKGGKCLVCSWEPLQMSASSSSNNNNNNSSSSSTDSSSMGCFIDSVRH